MAPRGLSAEEKRVKLVELFHESKDFFQLNGTSVFKLKELEKLGPKMKGIVSQSVKEVLQSCVDDGLVQADKIGSSNFFWSFPSQQGAMMQSRMQGAQDAQAALKKQLDNLKREIKTEQEARPESEERSAALNELASLKDKLASLQHELTQYGACDPKQIEEKKRAVTLAQEAAIRWTDNVLILLTHFVRQHGADAAELRSYLGMKEDFEDLC